MEIFDPIILDRRGKKIHLFQVRQGGEEVIELIPLFIPDDRIPQIHIGGGGIGGHIQKGHGVGLCGARKQQTQK